MEQDQQKQTLEESSCPEAIGVTRAMHQSKVRGRKRERNKHGFLAALLVLAMVALVAGAAFLLKHYVVNELLPREQTVQPQELAPEPPAQPSNPEPAESETPDLPAEEPADEPVADTPEEPVEVVPADDPAEPEEDTPDTPATASLSTETDATQTLDLELYSEHAILIDLETNTVIAEKDPDAKIYPASMTKVMTLLVAAENLPDLDATFTMTQAIIDPIYLAGASMAGFVDGETVSMRDLLYGAVVPSGAEATEALAQAVAGSEEAFVTMMNEKAAALGLTSTHFMNTSGLHDEDHYSTVREIALILQAALQNEVCAEVLSAENYRASRTEQHPDGLAMTNKFLYRVHHEYSLGGAEITAAKTGYTAEAMNCCASAGKTPDGRSVICVTANAWTGEFCIEDHIALDSKYCGSAESE